MKPIKYKYFKELKYYNHLDYRYGKQNMDIETIQKNLLYLLGEFSKYCKKNDIKPVLMYGCLIGYYFNKQMLPWDNDIDIILLEPDIYKLKNYKSDTFIIEINPNCKNYNINDVNNIISARIISIDTGVFIDILYHKEEKGLLICKDKNNYKIEHILPLKKTKFHNIDIYIPNNIKAVLEQRYSKKVFIPLETEGYYYNSLINTWNKGIY